jgi:hypothetical protein
MSDHFSPKSRPRTIIYSRGRGFIDDFVTDLIQRDRIELIKFEEADCYRISSFSTDLEFSLRLPDAFAEKFDVPLTEKMIADYPQFFKKHYHKFASIADRSVCFGGGLKYDQLAAYFNLTYRFFHYHLTINRVELLISWAIPHSPGFDFILDEVARLLDIKSIFFYATTVADKGWSMIIPEYDAISNHNLLIPLQSGQHVELDSCLDQYADMVNILKRQNDSRFLYYRFVPYSLKYLYLVITIFCTQIRSHVAAYFSDSYKKVRVSTGSGTSRTRVYRSLFRQIWHVIKTTVGNCFVAAWYFNRLLRISKSESVIDWNSKYVYFPLHYQPELTTAVLGDVYENQLYAIECLERILPDDWKVYVKEHPVQIYGHASDSSVIYWRSAPFFLDRIQKNHKIIIVRDDVDSIKLIQKSEFVATVTGTAGWEALLRGKQVLAFGNAWYGNFPGCTMYRSSTSLKDILSNKVDNNKLQEAVNFFVNRLPAGTISIDAINRVKNFDTKNNSKAIADAIEKYIDYYFEHCQKK